MTLRLVTIAFAFGFFLTPCLTVRLDAETASVEDTLGQIDGLALTNLGFSATLVLSGFDDVPLLVIGGERIR